MVSAFSALADRSPDAITGLFKQSALAADGRYDVRLFDPKNNVWADVTIDDRLPMGQGGDECRFTKPSVENELWPPLLEKACAKVCMCVCVCVCAARANGACTPGWNPALASSLSFSLARACAPCHRNRTLATCERTRERPGLSRVHLLPSVL